MYPIQNRTSWSTEIKILCQQGLEVAVPEQVLKAIPSSNFYRWKKERDDKYIGADLNILAKASHDELIRYAEAGQLKKVIAGLFKIQDVYRGIVQKVKGIPNQMRESKEQIVDTIQELKSTVGLENVLKAFDMSRATYQRWLLDVKVACDGSYFQWCVKQNPLQVSRPEMEKMKELRTEDRFLYWPISSLAAFARREGTLHLCDTTFYKYRRLLGIVRPKAKTRRKTAKVGVRASQPNEIWHGDVSVIKIGLKKFYLYLVVDNYSRRQLSWRLCDRLCKYELLATMKDAYRFGLKHLKELDVQLWVDGGSENNNAVVDEFIQRSQIGIHKVVAQKDVDFSNSMIEAVFKVIKYQCIYPHDPDVEQKLRSLLAFAFHEYDLIRPHGSLDGLTPDESYRGLRPDYDMEKLHLKVARTQRIEYNLKNQCGKCTISS